MVVVMKATATEDDIEHVEEKVREAGGEAFVSRGKSRTIIGLVGDTARFTGMPIQTYSGVDHVILIGKPYKMVARSSIRFRPRSRSARPPSDGSPST